MGKFNTRQSSLHIYDVGHEFFNVMFFQVKVLTHISFSFVTLLALVFLSRRTGTEVVRAHFKAVLSECNARKSDE